MADFGLTLIRRADGILKPTLFRHHQPDIVFGNYLIAWVQKALLSVAPGQLQPFNKEFKYSIIHNPSPAPSALPAAISQPVPILTVHIYSLDHYYTLATQGLADLTCDAAPYLTYITDAYNNAFNSSNFLLLILFYLLLIAYLSWALAGDLLDQDTEEEVSTIGEISEDAVAIAEIEDLEDELLNDDIAGEGIVVVEPVTLSPVTTIENDGFELGIPTNATILIIPTTLTDLTGMERLIKLSASCGTQTVEAVYVDAGTSPEDLVVDAGNQASAVDEPVIAVALPVVETRAYADAGVSCDLLPSIPGPANVGPEPTTTAAPPAVEITRPALTISTLTSRAISEPDASSAPAPPKLPTAKPKAIGLGGSKWASPDWETAGFNLAPKAPLPVKKTVAGSAVPAPAISAAQSTGETKTSGVLSATAAPFVFDTKGKQRAVAGTVGGGHGATSSPHRAQYGSLTHSTTDLSAAVEENDAGEGKEDAGSDAQGDENTQGGAGEASEKKKRIRNRPNKKIHTPETRRRERASKKTRKQKETEEAAAADAADAVGQ